MKKLLFLLTACVLCSSFRYQGPSSAQYPEYIRRMPLRPYPFKYYLSNEEYKKDNWLEKNVLKFYDRTDRSKVLLELNIKGIFLEAKKYSNRKEFRNFSPVAYKSAILKGWIEDICEEAYRLANF